MSIFNELKSSLEEAVEIHNGRKAASRVTRYEVADVRAIREQLNITQSEMAKALGTSVDTIKSWESKRRNPTGLAAKVLNVIRENPAFYKALAGQRVALMPGGAALTRPTKLQNCFTVGLISEAPSGSPSVDITLMITIFI